MRLEIRHFEIPIVMAVVAVCGYLAGLRLLYGAALAALLFGTLLFLTIRVARKDSLTVFLLITVFWLGFLQEPIGPGRYAVWLREGLVVAILAPRLLAGGGRATIVPFLFLYGSFILLTLPFSLASDSAMIYLIGLRRIGIAPLMFLIGQMLATPRSLPIVNRLLTFTLILQLPASLFVSYWATGSPWAPGGPDVLTGTFGRGGSGFVAIFGCAVTAILLWRLINRRISLFGFLLAASAFAVLTMLSDLKFVYLLLPLLLIVTLLLGLKNGRRLRTGGAPRKRKAMLAGAFAVVALGFALLWIVDVSSRRYNPGELSLSSFFDADYYRRYFSVDSGGIAPAGGGNPARYTRYGAILAAFDIASRDWSTILGGSGVGGTAGGVLGTPRFLEENPLEGIDTSALSILIVETGIVGTLLYLVPMLAFMGHALVVLLGSATRNVPQRLLAGTVVIWGTAVTASLVYNSFFLTPQGGGVFWFLAGLWAATRRWRVISAHETDGLMASPAGPGARQPGRFVTLSHERLR